MYTSDRNNILYFITQDNSLKIVEYKFGIYEKTIIDNDILESAMSMMCTSDKKLLVNTIDSETHILNLTNNQCERISSANIDGIPAKITQFFTSTRTTITILHTHKIINIDQPLRIKAVIDLHLDQDETIICVRLVPGSLIMFTNLSTRILPYDTFNNTCCTKNETMKIIQKKYDSSYLLGTNIIFTSNNTVDIYEKNFMDSYEILSGIEIKTRCLLNKNIYLLGKTHTQWMLYCCSTMQQGENDVVTTMNKENYYICKIFDKVCDDVNMHQSCVHHGYQCCTCLYKYILLHNDVDIEFISIVNKTVTKYEMEYHIKHVIIVNCSRLVIVTDTNNLRYYEITQDEDKFVMNYKEQDEHMLKSHNTYSKKASHHLLIINDMKSCTSQWVIYSLYISHNHRVHLYK